MDDVILITELNDFIFCPASIYFHKLYGSMDKMLYQSENQINGSASHKKVDDGSYSSMETILMGTEVYCEKYGLTGKIDIFDIKKGILRERKKKIRTVYDGYIYQVYAQYFSLIEMGYDVKKIELYSMDDHKTYNVSLPHDNHVMLAGFEQTISEMHKFQLYEFHQTNVEKCRKCIYEPACDRTLLEDD